MSGANKPQRIDSLPIANGAGLAPPRSINNTNKGDASYNITHHSQMDKAHVYMRGSQASQPPHIFKEHNGR